MDKKQSVFLLYYMNYNIMLFCPPPPQKKRSLSQVFFLMDFGKNSLKICPFKNVKFSIQLNAGLALLVSARVVTEKTPKAFGAKLQKNEKDSILLFINESFAAHLRHKGQEAIC